MSHILFKRKFHKLLYVKKNEIHFHNIKNPGLLIRGTEHVW